MTSPADEGLSVRNVLQAVAAAGRPALAVTGLTAEDVDHWRTQLRTKLWNLLGASGQPVDRDVEIVQLVSERGFNRSLLRYETEPGVTTTAWLLEPTPLADRARPAILALHGHGNGKDDVVGLAHDPTARAHIAERNYDYGRQLVRRGYVVLVPDARGFGERAADGCHVAGLVSLYQGRCVAGQRLWDDLRSLDVLAAWPTVDATRLGCGGLSEGGKRALFVSAFDDRVRISVVSGYFTSIATEIRMWDRLALWDICNSIPGLLRVADLPDIAALIAPRHLVIEIGRDDELYTQSGVLAGFEQACTTWNLLGVPGHVALDHFDGAHEWSGRIAYRLLDDVLCPQCDPAGRVPT